MKKKNLQSQNLRKKFYQKKKKGGKKKNQKKVAFTYSLRTLAEILYSTSLEQRTQTTSISIPFLGFQFQKYPETFCKGLIPSVLFCMNQQTLPDSVHAWKNVGLASTPPQKGNKTRAPSLKQLHNKCQTACCHSQIQTYAT